MTGGAPIAGVRDALASVANPVLEKPFDLAALLTALRAAAPTPAAAGRAG